MWCPKYRRPVLTGDVAERLRALLAEKSAELGMTIHALEVMPDHVHLFVESDPTRCVAEIVDRLKGYTSRVLRQEFASLRSRLPTLWSRSDFAGSIGQVSTVTIERDIAEQKGKEAVRRSFRFRLKPNRSQGRDLAKMRETHRRLYNACLEERKTTYEATGATVKYTDQSAGFTAARKTNPFYAEINFSSAQATMRRLDKAYKAFFRRVKSGEKPGFPRFKGRDHFDSIEFPSYGDGIRLNGDRLRVQAVGAVKVVQHREIEGTIKTVTLKCEADKWYVVFSCELPDVPILSSDLPPVGIDVGLEKFLSTSDGAKPEPNPRYLKGTLPELRRKQRSLSRKKKGGKNRRKARKAVARVHARVKNLRREHHHQTALKLVRRYGFIAAESLSIKNMLGNGRLSRAISDVAWGNFLLTLRSKAESAGVAFVEVDARGTSQLCSGCGAEVRKDLSVRWHDCPHCGLSLDRDENAARNILARGLLARNGPVGAKVGVAQPCPGSRPL